MAVGGARLAAQIEVNSSAAIASIAQANKAFDQFDEMLKACDTDLKKMEKSMGLSVGVIQKQGAAAKQSETSWVKMAATLYTVRNAAHMLGGALTEAYAAASEGAKIGAAQQFFENSGKSISTFREATRGMVSDSELMKKANLADSMGIDEGTFKKLAQVAEAASLKTGQSFDLMFNSIIVGTARSSRLLLDNLGIIVSVGQANENYAKQVLSVGSSTAVTTAQVNAFVEAMTAEQKQLAFVAEVAKKSEGMLDEYGKVVDKTAEAYARLDATVQNTADAIKVGLSQAFAQSASDLEVYLRSLNTVVDKLGGLRAAGLLAMDAMSFIVGDGGPSRMEQQSLRQESKAAEERGYATAGATGVVKTLTELIGSQWRDAVQNYVNLGTAGIDKFTDELIESFLKMNTLSGNAFGGWRRQSVDPPAPFATVKEKKGPQRQYDTAGVMGMYAEEDAMMKEYWKSRKKSDQDKLDAALFVEQENAKLNKRLLDEQLDTLEKWRKTQEDLAEAAAKLRKEIDDQFNSDVGNVASATLSGGGGAAVGNILGGAAAGAVGGPFGAVIGALVAALGGLLDSLQPLMTLVNDIVGGLTLLVGNALDPLLSALLPLGPALVALLGAFGMLTRIALEPLVQLIKMIVVPLSMFISLLAAAFAVMAVGIQALSALSSALFFIKAPRELGAAFDRLDDWLDNGVRGVVDFTNGLLTAVANINNGIVTFIRRIPGMNGFGSLMTASQFTLPPPEADPAEDDNTDAVNENTAALRDLQREFRNLPSSYKANGVIFGSTTAERSGFRQPPRGTINARWRT